MSLLLVLLACMPPPPLDAGASPCVVDLSLGRRICRTEFPDAVCYSSEAGLSCWPKAHEDDAPADLVER